MNPKMINLIGNIFLALNLVAGLLMLHWAVIAVFGILHTAVRLAYLSAIDKLAQASQDANSQSNTQKTVTAPPMIRNVASVVTGFIVAGILYAIGYGLKYGFNMLA